MRLRGSVWPSCRSGIMLLVRGGSPHVVLFCIGGASRFFQGVSLVLMLVFFYY